MAFKKTKDLAVITGSYIDKDQKNKNRYQNVGYILEDENGAKMIMLNRSFNPAGVPHKDGSDTIIINQFEPKDAAKTAPLPSTPPPQAFDDMPF